MKKFPSLLVVAAWAVGLLGSHAIGSMLQPQDPHWFWGDTTGPPSLVPGKIFEPHTKAMAEEVNNNFCRIIDYLDGPIQDSLDDHDSRIVTNEGELLDHGARLDTAEGDLINQGGRIVANEASIADLQGRVSDVETRVGVAETAITALDGRVGDLEGDVAQLDAQVSLLEGRLLIVEDFIQNVVPTLHGEMKFDSLGSHSWQVPAQVDKVVLTVVGAGGGSGTYGTTTADGGDGASVWMQEIYVTPGEMLSIEVGAGGDSVTGVNVTGVSGGASSVTAVSGTWQAAGGEGGTSPDGPLSGGTPGNSPAPQEGFAFRLNGQGSSSSAAAGGDGIVILRW